MLHEVVVGQGWVQAPDFWRMAPGQVWWLVEDKTPQEHKARAGDMREIVKMVKAAKAAENE